MASPCDFPVTYYVKRSHANGRFLPTDADRSPVSHVVLLTLSCHCRLAIPDSQNGAQGQYCGTLAAGNISSDNSGAVKWRTDFR